MSTGMPRYLTPGEVAELLRVPAARVVRFARKGNLPHYVLPDGELLFSEEEVRDWLAQSRPEVAVQTAGRGA